MTGIAKQLKNHIYETYVYTIWTIFIFDIGNMTV